MSSVSSTVKPYLGYVVSTSTTDGSYSGGVLITDALGLPVEFRHTQPVTPSRLQRILYGRALDGHMHGDVVTPSLLTAVEHKPALYIVGDAAYLNAAAAYGAPSAILTHNRAAGSQEKAAPEALGPCDIALQLGIGNGALRVRLQANGNEGAIKETVATLLTEFSLTMEIMEPLARIQDALRLLQEADEPGQVNLKAA